MTGPDLLAELGDFPYDIEIIRFRARRQFPLSDGFILPATGLDAGELRLTYRDPDELVDEATKTVHQPALPWLAIEADPDWKAAASQLVTAADDLVRAALRHRDGSAPSGPIEHYMMEFGQQIVAATRIVRYATFLDRETLFLNPAEPDYGEPIQTMLDATCVLITAAFQSGRGMPTTITPRRP